MPDNVSIHTGPDAARGTRRTGRDARTHAQSSTYTSARGHTREHKHVIVGHSHSRHVRSRSRRARKPLIRLAATALQVPPRARRQHEPRRPQTRRASTWSRHAGPRFNSFVLLLSFTQPRTHVASTFSHEGRLPSRPSKAALGVCAPRLRARGDPVAESNGI